jgi:hypothetical protein
MSSNVRDYEELYREAWERLKNDRQGHAEIDDQATPILSFGDWQRAVVLTVGLNPSEREFRNKNGDCLPEQGRRFLHWPKDGELTPRLLSEAREMAEGYFTRGNAYLEWFGKYFHFLGALGVSFVEGTACHSDCASPFATRTGIGNCKAGAQRLLSNFGYGFWIKCLDVFPETRIVFGHGRFWRNLATLNGVKWTGIPTYFDTDLAPNDKTRRPFLMFGWLNLDRRMALIYWWIPNRGEPLTWLSHSNAEILGKVVNDHAKEQGIVL